TGLIFDTLVTIDDTGRVKPALSDAWQFRDGTRRCTFHLRRDVKFHDGGLLTPEVVAASLRFAHPSWTVLVSGDSLVADGGIPGGSLLAEVSLPRSAIVKRDAGDKKISGTGPFHIENWDPGKKLTLAAEERHWRGRPYLDLVEVKLGDTFREQNTALQLGKSDLVEISPEQAQHAMADGRRLEKSAPIELLAIVFDAEASAEEKELRDALAWSVERTSINDVLLKRAGQPTGSILPTWISGYGFVFPYGADLARARQLRSEFHSIPLWKLGYDNSDSLDRLVAERIALNAKDAGLWVQPIASGAADLRLVRIPLRSFDPRTALEGFADQAGIAPIVVKGNSSADIYDAERALLMTGRAIPLFHLPLWYSSSAALKSWRVQNDGSLDLSDAWLGTTKP
ncbi:MAG TPA: ABC transporter substrate-binding protein, partial [Candidatus Acidoferrum sp.]|nr:ABC transporter substrate-binding protein [Candidatus Acidoferrum sp.]